MVDGKGRIEVFDSASISLGQGMIAIAAAKLAKAGGSISGVIEETRDAISQIHIWAFFDTLKYVFRGGRLGKATHAWQEIL
jgi:fatty acid-binding protein DegV